MRIHTTIVQPELWISIDFIRPLSLQFLGQRTGSEVCGYHTGIPDVKDYPHRPEAYMIVMLFKWHKKVLGSYSLGKLIREATMEHLRDWKDI